MTTPKLCRDCINYHVPASKEPCRDCLPQTVAVPNFTRNPYVVSSFEWPHDDIIIEYKVL